MTQNAVAAETPAAYFANLRTQFNGPTLSDTRAWSRLDLIERKALLRLAGYTNQPQQSYHRRGPIDRYAPLAWHELPDAARSGVKKAARKLRTTLGGFEGVRVEK